MENNEKFNNILIDWEKSTLCQHYLAQSTFLQFVHCHLSNTWLEQLLKTFEVLVVFWVDLIPLREAFNKKNYFFVTNVTLALSHFWHLSPKKCWFFKASLIHLFKLNFFSMLSLFRYLYREGTAVQIYLEDTLQCNGNVTLRQ